MASALNTIMLPDLETSISNFHTTAKRDAACEEGEYTIHGRLHKRGEKDLQLMPKITQL